MESFLSFFCPGHIDTQYPRENSQAYADYSPQLSDSLITLPSGRFSWICFFQENWRHSGQVKAFYLSLSPNRQDTLDWCCVHTSQSRVLEVVPDTGQVSAFWRSAIDTLQVRPSPQALGSEGFQDTWRELQSVLFAYWDRWDHTYLPHPATPISLIWLYFH